MKTAGTEVTSFDLKIIAMAAMLCDHIADVFLPPQSIAYGVLRTIGRMSFILFAFMIGEGFRHTSDVRKYFLRLLAMAFISEVPFDLAFHDAVLEFSQQNIFFTLSLGLLSLIASEKAGQKMEERMGAKTVPAIFARAIVVAAFAAAAVLIRCDYGAQGILMIAAFYYLRGNWIGMTGATALASLPIGAAAPEIYGLPAFIFLYYYHGKKGPSMKALFYLFYPVHLMVLALISMALK